MEITIPSIIAFVTLLIGLISRKLNIYNKKYIPIQNVLIGLLSGFLVWLTGLESNIYNALITCLISALSAGGLYDTLRTRKVTTDENKY